MKEKAISEHSQTARKHLNSFPSYTALVLNRPNASEVNQGYRYTIIGSAGQQSCTVHCVLYVSPAAGYLRSVGPQLRELTSAVKRRKNSIQLGLFLH